MNIGKFIKYERKFEKKFPGKEVSFVSIGYPKSLGKDFIKKLNSEAKRIKKMKNYSVVRYTYPKITTWGPREIEDHPEFALLHDDHECLLVYSELPSLDTLLSDIVEDLFNKLGEPPIMGVHDPLFAEIAREKYRHIQRTNL